MIGAHDPLPMSMRAGWSPTEIADRCLGVGNAKEREGRGLQSAAHRSRTGGDDQRGVSV